MPKKVSSKKILVMPVEGICAEALGIRHLVPGKSSNIDQWPSSLKTVVFPPQGPVFILSRIIADFFILQCQITENRGVVVIHFSSSRSITLDYTTDTRFSCILVQVQPGGMNVKRKPHILFIFPDQLRADCLSCAGHPLLRTPNIDRLAGEGVRFDNCFTTSPLCVPARFSVTTGLYPHNSNLWQNDATCPTDADTYMHRLKKAGYRTCSIGKNHLYPMSHCDMIANEPNYHAIGFDHIEDIPGTWGVINVRSVYTNHLESLGLLDGLREYLKKLEAMSDRKRRFTAEALPIPSEHYIDSYITARVERYIDRYDLDDPSFIYVGFQGPHEPWDAPDEYAERFTLDEIPDPIPEFDIAEMPWLSAESVKYHRYAQYFQPEQPIDGKKIAARYFGNIALIDDSVGRILQAYKRKGWLDNTIVVFASDHGEMLGDLARLSKSMFYESAVRVPLIVRLPAHQVNRGNRVCSHLVETIDIYSTLVDLAGAEPNPQSDSISLLPLVEDRGLPVREDILSEVHVHYMLRTREWKLVVGRNGSSLQLFDLVHDPLEQRNLCGHPEYRTQELEMRSRMLKRLAADTYRPGSIDPEFSGHSYPDNAEKIHR